VSTQNWGQLKMMTETVLTSTALALNFDVYSYDPVPRAYFSALAPQQPPLHAIVAKSGATPQLQAAAAPIRAGSLQVYEFSLVATPLPNQVQSFRVATNPTQVVTQPWGF
jgi:hypothetical protein